MMVRIGDLTADDIQITDQGKPQTVISFRKTVQGGPALGPNEFSNKATGGGGRTTVVLFDLLNQARTNGLDSAHKLGRALGQLQSGESLYFYILGLDGNLFPIHPIPAPGAASTDDKTWTQQADAQIQSAMKTVNRARKAGMTNEDFTKKTYVALETLAKDLSVFRGARNIIWVTDGVPYVFPAKYQDNGCQGDWFGDCALYLPHLSVRLASTNTQVYPLTYTMSPDTNTSRDMDYFGSSTGGQSFSGIALGDLLTQLGADSQAMYTVTYQPAADNWDQKFHKVKVASHKGLKIQGKNRYFAIPVAEQDAAAAPPAPPAADEDAAIIAALESPANISSIGLRVAVSPAAGKKAAVHFQISIDAADLKMQEKAGAFDDQIAVMFADYTAGGLKSLPTASEIPLHLTAEQHAKALKEGLGFGVDHAVDSSIHNVRFVVFDHASNAYGSLSIPVTAPDAPAAK
jgi:VWFA-related protein